MQCMKPIGCIVLISFGMAAPVAHAERSPAENLTIIADPAWGKREETQRRFAFILPRFVSLCSDVDEDERAADYLFVTWKRINEAGLGTNEGGLVGMSNNLFDLTNSLAALGGAFSRNMKCSETFAMYIQLRLSGKSSEAAKNGMYELIRALSTAK